MHLAVVCAPDIVQFSSRFAELVAAERRDRFFDIFDTRAAAREWLARAASVDRADGVPRSRHIRPRRFTRQCLPISGDRR